MVSSCSWLAKSFLARLVSWLANPRCSLCAHGLHCVHGLQILVAHFVLMAFLGFKMDPARVATKKRVWRLMESASLDTLQEVEALLRARSNESRQELLSNPSGSRQPTSLCGCCSRPRPPHPEAPPWPVRADSKKPFGALCKACIWHRRHSKPWQQCPGHQQPNQEGSSTMSIGRGCL